MTQDDSIYSLIALDIDGTMIGDDREVKPELVKAIARVKETGAVVSVSTGRTLTPALKIARESGASGPVICFQGAMTFDQVTKSALRHERLEADLAIRAIEGLKSSVPEVMMFLGDDVWVEKRSDWTDGYGQRMGVDIRDTDSLLNMADQLPTAIVGVGEPDVVGPLVLQLHKQMNGSALVTHSLPMFCEVEAIGAGKDLAVEHLANSLNISQDQVIAVGDGKGDQSMIKWAGLGVGIAGGHPDVLAISDRIIATPEERGLTHLLEELLEDGKLGPAQTGIN
ncbi:HAD-IIB family hydrolase [Candidatus Lucifugimonas marina]|uniref:HAD-IIB family hydrolase n=1 Tax=Candidatus Lucifugimonas marina TaxID=3038979 RepID=A0AAJ5ZH65_9CHLR|nr:HAD-IIB family hydrolase [SAR202 cluster bacterium JH702]MDG0868705.1 HAD-IIB family hydrolase [SAR202 cluster bacterium JH639]WFG35337.1 HAD-IIB family hydrolase [SAR202 cluster bacterium JH545]WFG39285.1 HAD-IIB family hydrolase [SAR202 cluster bacterium JH1073]